jgi:hypothetical protein
MIVTNSIRSSACELFGAEIEIMTGPEVTIRALPRRFFKVGLVQFWKPVFHRMTGKTK